MRRIRKLNRSRTTNSNALRLLLPLGFLRVDYEAVAGEMARITDAFAASETANEILQLHNLFFNLFQKVLPKRSLT